MITRHRPALALWLLERRVRNPALAGDLLEQFQAGKSRAWFWRQTLVALAIAWVRGLRASARYQGPVCGGFAVQTAIVFALWHVGVPLKVPAWGIAMCGLLLANAIAGAALRDRVTGRASIDLRRLLFRDPRQGDRRVISCLLGWETFTSHLFLYCGWACFFPLSFSDLLVTQAIWLLMEIALPPLFSETVRPSAEDS